MLNVDHHQLIIYITTLCSYYEGQLTPISEIDVEDEVQAPPVRVTEAAEKVCYYSSLKFE